MIIAFVSQKGGVGKSSVCANLAAFLTDKGKPVLVIDSDPQQSTRAWNERRESVRLEEPDLVKLEVVGAVGEDLKKQAQKASEAGALVLIDTAGTDSENMRKVLLLSDRIITVSSPSGLDIRGVDYVIKLCKEAGKARKRALPVALIFNKIPTNKKVKLYEEAMEFLELNKIRPDYIFKSALKDRVAYQYSMSDGISVSEFEKNGKASKEFLGLMIEFLIYLS